MRPTKYFAWLRAAHGLPRSAAVVPVGVLSLLFVACSNGAASPRGGAETAPAHAIAELPFRAPPATSEAPARDGLTSLQSPRGRRGVSNLLRAYFEAIVAESRPDLAKVTHDSAMAHAPNSTPTSLLGSWSRRFTRLRYDSVDPAALFTPRDIELYEPADVARLDSRKGFHLAPGSGELLAVVGLSGPDELFGSRMELVLVPVDDGFRIRAAYEDYTPR